MLVGRRTLIFQTSKFGSIDSIFKFPILKKKKCLTIDTREINELGPGKFRADAQNGLEQVCYFNRNKTDSHFTSYIAKRVSPVNLVFYIHKLNLDFNLDNKSWEIQLNNSVADGISKSQYQSVNKEHTENGTESTSTRSETNQEGGGGNRLDSSELAESAISGGGHERGGKHRGEPEPGNIRKKPKFLS